ncbi:MAG: spore germination protein [Clostridiales bacterium]|nr:spore germination protein [Clostridiales bacterium]
MFGFLYKKAKALFSKKGTDSKQEDFSQKQTPVSRTLADNIKTIREEMLLSCDVISREITIGKERSTRAAIIFIDGMADKKIINDNVLKPLMNISGFPISPGSTDRKTGIIKVIEQSVLAISNIAEVQNINEAISELLTGNTVLFVDGDDTALAISAKGFEKRSVDEPPSEAVIRGPRECFIEDIKTNTSLIRRKIKNQELRVETMTIGQRTRTVVSIAYISGVANAGLVETVKNRLKAISTDSILESGYIEQFIEDSPASIFSTIGYTEKPDVAAAKILEGRVAILVDGTPFVLTAPMLFAEYFQSAEDYYFRPYYATLLRIVRIIAAMTTILAPAIYVSVTTFHQELLPTGLLITMASAREGIPFPAFVECLIMIVTFEILREAGIRLPRTVGQALSIVGALVIGESAVAAGLIGAPMVIFVAITAVSSFVVPNLIEPIAVLRFIVLILGSMFGGYGITIAMLGALVHMASLNSFGFPYLSPTAPFDPGDSKDAIVRAPLWMMIKRPKSVGAADKKRRDKVVPPPTGENDGGEDENA